tara:strand:+ start:697 stop:1023 length:327 start_codon:yes stop_codon:yes gene_type:complete
MSSFETFFEPGNGKRYHIMAARVDRENGQTGWLISWMKNSGSGGTCIWLADGGGHVHDFYVQEKMGCFREDARVLADYINDGNYFPERQSPEQPKPDDAGSIEWRDVR